MNTFSFQFQVNPSIDRKTYNRRRNNRNASSIPQRCGWSKICPVSTQVTQDTAPVPISNDTTAKQSPIWPVSQVHFESLVKFHNEIQAKKQKEFEIRLQEKLDRSMRFLLAAEQTTRVELMCAGDIASVIKYEKLRSSLETLWM